MIATATRVPEARSRLLRWAEGRTNTSLQPETMFSKAHTLPSWASDLPKAQQPAALTTWFATIIRTASLFWVAPTLTELAEHAGTQLPEHRLHPEMLPDTTGLLCWATPIKADTTDNTEPLPREIVGAVWQALPEGIWVETLQDPRQVARSINPHLDETEIEHHTHGLGWLSLDEEIILPWDQPWMISSPTAARSRAIATLAATWLLMGQTITTNTTKQPQPKEVRRLQRRGDPNPTVNTIALRRAQRPNDDNHPTAGREYRHQWVVSGHWRKQWYASIEDHRPIWISPHIKGPDGAPLLKTERVYTLNR
jgi:hypothetical protein